MISKRLSGLVNDIFPFPLLPLSLLVGIFYVNFVCRVAIAPLLPVIKADLGLGLTKAGSLFLLTATGYCSGLFMSGFVTARLSHRWTLLLSMGVMGAAMLALSQTASSTGMYLALITAGLSAGFYLPSGIVIVTELVSREHWGRAMAFHELAPNLGFITAPLLAEALLRLLSWRGALAFMGSWSILMGLVFFFFGQGGEASRRGAAVQCHARHLDSALFLDDGGFLHCIDWSEFWSLQHAASFPGQRAGDESGVGEYTRQPFENGCFFDPLPFGLDYGQGRAKIRDDSVSYNNGSLHPADRDDSGSRMTPLLVVLQASSAACMFPVGFTMLSALFPNSLRSLAVSLVIMIGYLIGGGAFPLGIGYIAERLYLLVEFFSYRAPCPDHGSSSLSDS